MKVIPVVQLKIFDITNKNIFTWIWKIILLIFLNGLLNDIKLEINLFADDVKLLYFLLKIVSRIETDQYECSYWEDIWKLKFDIEKGKVRHSGSKNI